MGTNENMSHLFSLNNNKVTRLGVMKRFEDKLKYYFIFVKRLKVRILLYFFFCVQPSKRDPWLSVWDISAQDQWILGSSPGDVRSLYFHMFTSAARLSGLQIACDSCT
jgi:hypothetical protein